MQKVEQLIDAGLKVVGQNANTFFFGRAGRRFVFGTLIAHVHLIVVRIRIDVALLFFGRNI